MSARRLLATCLSIAALTAVAPSSALGVRFMVKGDWGAGTKAQTTLTERMCVENSRTRAAFILTTGDNFYPQGTATQNTFTTPERCLWTTGIRWRAVWGNHDVPGPSTSDLLKSPSRWYTFIAGPARVIALDANQPRNSDQLAFLKRTLAAEKLRPVIVAYHQGTRTAGFHAPQVSQQELWEPLFIKHKVRLVLQGHNHLYERIAYEGVTYVTTGGGGANLYPCSRKAAGLVTCQSVHNFLMVEVTPKKIGVRAFDSTGKIIDRFRFTLTPPA